MKRGVWDEPYVSIIVPVYNTEAYLSRCLASVLNQSFSNYELLIIDDGSTDNSCVICREYSERDSRIRVFHKDNEGVSSARNLGLNYARGEWIYFVDSDDEVLPNGLQTLVDCISSEVDIVMGGFVEEDETGRKSEGKEVLSLSKKQSVISLYAGYSSHFFYCGYLWMRLLRRSVIQRYGITFDNSIAIKEDTLFLMQYICRSRGITCLTTTPVYKYCRRPESAMGRATNGFDRKYVDSFYALVKMKHEVEALFPSYSFPVFIAKQEIYRRYCTLVDKMEANHFQDDELRSEIYSIMHEEVGSVFFFKVERRIRKFFSHRN